MRRTPQEKGKLSFEEKKRAFNRVGLPSEFGFMVLPAGIDKVYAEVILSRSSYNYQLKVASEHWKKKPRTTGESSFTHITYDNKGCQRFYFKLYRDVRPDPVTQRGTDSWLLLIEFNPSDFMYLTGAKEAIQGENYIAGNALAFELAMKELEKILQSDVFNKLETVERKPLNAWASKLTQPHFARDIQLHPLHLKFRRKFGRTDSPASWEHFSQATWGNQQALKILGLFANSSPQKIHRYDASKSKEFTLLQDHIKDLGRKTPKRTIDASRRRDLMKLKRLKVDGQNPLGSPINYICRAILSRHDVFYVKERYNKARRFQGAVLRFELKLLKSEGRKLLGIEDLAGLHQLLVENDAWHEGGRVGEIPLIERLLNRRLQELNKPLGETRQKAELRFIPAPSKDLMDVILQTEKELHEMQKRVGLALGVALAASEADHDAFMARLEEVKAQVLMGQSLDFAELETLVFCLKMALKYLKPMTVQQIMGRITGFLDSKNKPTLIEAAGEPYKNLRVLVAYFLDFYDGDFQGFSKFDEREVLIHHLMQH